MSERAVSGFKARFSGGVRAVAAAALAALLCVWVTPTSAFAYFSKDPVSISFGSSSVSVAAGSSATVSLSVSPMSEQQLPGCGMAICPQECNGLATPDGVVGGCLNDAGWCTCGGTTYYTAYTNVTVSSSNPYVARASVAGSALTVTGVSEGTATITVYGQLDKHADASASMQVTVGAASSGGSAGGSGSGGGTGSGGGSDSGSGSGSGGGVSVTDTGASVTAAAAEAAENEEAPVVEMETEEGLVIVVKATDAASAAEELGKIAGTEGTCTFWVGDSMDSPQVSWTFKGTDIAEGADLAIDPSVSLSRKGTGDVAKLLADVDSSLVVDFAHSGALPGPAEVYVRASGVFDDGQTVSLYCYDEDARKFTLEQTDVEVKDGYAVFTIDHCSTWALSDEDLTALELADDEASDEGDEGTQTSASQVDVKPQDGSGFLIAAAVVAVVVIAAVVAVVVMRRRRAGAGDAADAGADAGAGDAADESADASSGGADAGAASGAKPSEGDVRADE